MEQINMWDLDLQKSIMKYLTTPPTFNLIFPTFTDTTLTQSNINVVFRMECLDTLGFWCLVSCVVLLPQYIPYIFPYIFICPPEMIDQSRSRQKFTPFVKFVEKFACLGNCKDTIKFKLFFMKSPNIHGVYTYQ